MKKILVLDDDLAVLEALEETLRYGEYEVRAISATADIFEEIEICHPDVIILDYILKGTNGGAWCRLIKDNPVTCHIPVILTSAYPRDLEPGNADYGFDDFIAKPFDIEDLLEVVKKHSSNTASAEQNRL
jgi:CheY-like chemotaxis protein